MLNGLSVLSLELETACNKGCWICGRRRIEKENPESYAEKYTKNMDFDFLKNTIAPQIPKDIVIQFHSNGEPTLYLQLKECLKLFPNNIRCFDTNGILLVDKAEDIIDNMESITISTFENDPIWERQYYNLLQFLSIKGNRKPIVNIRCLGDIGETRRKLYEDTGCTLVDRVLHSPMGSFHYKKKVTVPEIGICLEMLNHPVIDVNFNLKPCIRFDKDDEWVIGNLKNDILENLWNSKKRKDLVKMHVEGKRNDIEFCKGCKFWGCPTS
jgi:sulfatase maturation enzyme AslB (radical SAM superfamily)